MKIRILCIGDVVGQAGAVMLQKHLNQIREAHRIDATIVNGENSAADGRGIMPKNMHFFKHLNVDVVTSGNHIWDKKEIIPYLQENGDLLRPANYPSSNPGIGVTTIEVQKQKIAVIRQNPHAIKLVHTTTRYLVHHPISEFSHLPSGVTSRSGAFTGSQTLNVVPTPCTLSTSIKPPCSETIL